MAAKKAAADENEATKLLVDAISTAGQFDLVVVWSPGQANPVTCTHLRVNGMVLTTDQLFLHSPQIFRLPDPISGQFVVDWGLTPEVPLDQILIGIINRDSKARAVVDSKKNATRQPWSGQKVVRAP